MYKAAQTQTMSLCMRKTDKKKNPNMTTDNKKQ